MRYRGYTRFYLRPLWIIIFINLLLLVATYTFSDLLVYLGLIPIIFIDHPWTIVTSMFMHSGFWHFFANMLTLFFYGSYLSRLIGDSKFLIVYFVGGILGNVLYILLGEPISIVVGASGAIFAIGGAMAIMRPQLKVVIFPIPVPIPLWIAVIGGFIILSFLPLVAWQAHLGGLIVGLLAGCIFRRAELRNYLR